MMVSRYALVKNGVVENLVAWNGEGELFSEYLAVELADDTPASVGWYYDGAGFVAPPETEKTHDELVAAADAEKRSRLDYATSRIVVWQTKLLIGRKLTESESGQLNAWLDYIDDVTLIDPQSVPPLFPDTPDNSNDGNVQ